MAAPVRRSALTGCAAWLLAILVAAPPAQADDLEARRQAAKAAAARNPVNAAPLRLLNKTIIYIKDAYVDPSRIDAQRMLAAAMQTIARGAPQLTVESARDHPPRGRRCVPQLRCLAHRLPLEAGLSVRRHLPLPGEGARTP